MDLSGLLNATAGGSSNSGSGGYGSVRAPAVGGQQQQQQQQQQQTPGDAFTAEMRDRQARGKDPYESSDGSASDWVSDGTRKYCGGSSKEESFAVLERRRVAAQVLDSPELLMMAAQRDNESIPATRLRYTRMLCGFEEPAPARKKPYRSGDSSRAPSGPTPGRSSRKDAR